ncbi:retrotransposon protein, putative, ty1-copia subclass [Tanacetum coccineum]|uniref:Retrotransposon protein, putative, ty1-copia subclass n=1 Tax=Tanacetum coccineum TaxID=301880 RepID=A0ABQ5DPD3_9ASTR
MHKNHKNKKPQLAARGNNQGKGKSKLAYASKPKISPPPNKENPAKDSVCHQCGDGLEGSRKLKPGALSLYVGNGHHATIEAIGSFHLCLPSGLVVILHNCHYPSSITRGIILVSSLYDDGFINRFENNEILISRNNLVYFCIVLRDGIYEINLSNANTNDSSMYAVSNKRAKLNLDSTLLWHCRLGHISKKRIKKLQHDGLLNSTDIKSFENCVSCMSGKMARKPYSHQVKRDKDLLGLIHTDVCDPCRTVSRQGASCFVTFTNDFSRYSYVYLLKHKHEVFETFKVFQRDVENQLEKTIKLLRSDRGGEYMSQDFLDHLKEHGIISHRTPSYTPQHNGVSERKNRTLLDMVRSMISQTTLPKSFWDYALESVVRILNMVPTKKVEKTPYEETMGYSFYYPPENKVLVARKSECPTRTRHAPDHMCLYIDAEEHELRDLNESANYKAALLDPESNKWLNAMNVEMQSMKDNEVWDLVDLPLIGKAVGSKWLFKKKTDIDGAVHIYKARLVVKGYTQTYKIDYEKTFSPVVDIRTIRILIAITMFYDYEIWQMDVKNAFLNGHLSIEEVYMVKPEGEAAYILEIKIYRDRSRLLIGLCQSAYIKKILKRFYMENSKRESIPMQDKLKLCKSQGASTPAEVKRMQNVPYASAVGSIMYVTVVKNILKYLRNTKDMFLVYGGDIKPELRVSCYTDAGYLTDADDHKSQTGYIFVLNGGVVDWKSTKQSIFATSYAEADYIAALDAYKQKVWIRKFISRLGVVPTIEEPINMYCDNTRAITIANESGITKGARHYRAKVHYLHEVIEFGDVKIEKVHIDDNLADPFTKALPFPKHSVHTKNIGMLPASSLM